MGLVYLPTFITKKQPFMWVIYIHHSHGWYESVCPKDSQHLPMYDAMYART